MCMSEEDWIPHDMMEIPYMGDSSRPVPIDKEIIPIITEIWSLGIGTKFSCQGDGTEDDDGYVMFQFGIGNIFKVMQVVEKYGRKVIGITEDWDWDLREWTDFSPEAIRWRTTSPMRIGAREYSVVRFI